MIAPLLILPTIKKHNLKLWIAAYLVGLLILGGYSSQTSPLWNVSINAALEHYIFPFQARMDYFVNEGMPQDIQSNEYQTWFDKRAPLVYMKFLISHPGFIFMNVMTSLSYFRSDFIQPYFHIPGMSIRNTLIEIGEIVHPQTLGIYLEPIRK